MPAPTPIQIRYGPSGLLGQAVALAASRGAQQDQDYQFINSMTAHKNRTDELLMDDALQSRRLQLAHGYRVAQEQNPEQGSYVDNGTSDVGSQALKNTYLTSAAADLPEDQASQLRSLITNRGVTPEQFRSVVFDATRKAKDKTDKDTELQNRRNYVKAASEGLSPQDAATLSAMAEDPRVDVSQIRTAADVIKNRNTVLPRTRLTLQAQGIDMQARQLKGIMDNATRSLAKIGIDPESTPPAALNPTYKDAEAGVTHGQGFFGNIGDTYAGTGNLVTGGQPPEVMQQYTSYHKAKQAYNQLLAQRQQLLASGQGEGKQLTPDVAAAFLQRTGGDRDAARALAQQEGYSF